MVILSCIYVAKKDSSLFEMTVNDYQARFLNVSK